MKYAVRIFLVVGFFAWMVGWFWFFRFHYSASFFQYHLGTRLPFKLLSLLVVAVAPLSAFWAISRSLRAKVSAFRAVCIHALASAAPVLLFMFVSELWLYVARRAGRLAWEADEAMGIGIDFMVCVAVFLLSNLVVVCTLVLLKFLRISSSRPASPS